MDLADDVARLARRVLRLRRKRTDHLPAELFGEHAWNLLLVLFIADAEGERLSARVASERADVDERVGARWITALEALELVASHERCDDGHLVALTPKGVHAVEACMMDSLPVMVPR